MNKAVTRRIISKPEACVLLAELDLVYCTETTQSVSLSNSKKVTLAETGNSGGRETFINEYKNRPAEFEECNLHQYFNKTRNVDPNKKLVIPHFVGINGSPKYPVTDDYARHTLIVHRPWRQYPDAKTNWRAEFEVFINSSDCPTSARMSYERVMRRYIDKMTGYEPKASTADHNGNTVEEDDEELMILLGLKSDDIYEEDDVLFKQMDKGLQHKWDKQAKVRTQFSHRYHPKNKEF